MSSCYILCLVCSCCFSKPKSLDEGAIFVPFTSVAYTLHIKVTIIEFMGNKFTCHFLSFFFSFYKSVNQIIGFVEAVLYANLLRMPTFLPNQRSEDQIKQVYKMLSDCFRLTKNICSSFPMTKPCTTRKNKYGTHVPSSLFLVKN